MKSPEHIDGKEKKLSESCYVQCIFDYKRQENVFWTDC